MTVIFCSSSVAVENVDDELFCLFAGRRSTRNCETLRMVPSLSEMPQANSRASTRSPSGDETQLEWLVIAFVTVNKHQVTIIIKISMNKLLFCFLLNFCPLQERWEQQTYQDLPQRWPLWLLWASHLPVCGGANEPLPTWILGPVQRQAGHQTSLPCFQIPTGWWQSGTERKVNVCDCDCQC